MFVAVGAAHLAGPDSVLKMLEAKGVHGDAGGIRIFRVLSGIVRAWQSWNVQRRWGGSTWPRYRRGWVGFR